VQTWMLMVSEVGVTTRILPVASVTLVSAERG